MLKPHSGNTVGFFFGSSLHYDINDPLDKRLASVCS